MFSILELHHKALAILSPDLIGIGSDKVYDNVIVITDSDDQEPTTVDKQF